MHTVIELETARLKLRQWRDADYDPFAHINADPSVMAFFPAVLSRVQSDAMAARCRSLIAERGWGFWAAELKQTHEFIGFVGLHVPTSQLPFSPCVEVGWRLSRAHWGHGYATEAARAALEAGFTRLNVPEIVSFATLDNTRSQRVMEKVGLIRAAGVFEHPDVPPDSPLRMHCLYRLTREQWASAR